MPDPKTHAGGCHCGAVRYEATSDLAQVLSCNCSICQKRGALLTFIPAAQFKLLSGEDLLTDYQFNKKIIHHLFCKPVGWVRSRAARDRTAARWSPSMFAVLMTSTSRRSR